ncbi:MAG: HDOD domain-containing protein [Phycisphaerales bacterium]|nr:HDOD domain-containing protein [Phycisphaerales bacterium]
MTIGELLTEVQSKLVPPSVMVPELVRLMGDENAGMNAIGRCVASDPILASDALRVANSAAFAATSGPITDCVLAVLRLGESLVCTLVAERLRGSLASASRLVPHGDALWRHSLAVAIGARLIARASRFTAPALAFTTGLLVDVGRLVLAELLARSGQDLAPPIPVPGARLDDIERAMYGLDHAQLGAATARFWRIPEPIPSAIEASHRPMEARGEARLPAVVVHAADVIVCDLERAAGRNLPRYPVDRSAFAALKLDDAAIAQIGEALERERDRTLGALGLAA